MTYAEMLEALKKLTLTEQLHSWKCCCTSCVRNCNSVHNSYRLRTSELRSALPLHKHCSSITPRRLNRPALAALDSEDFYETR